MPVIVLADGNGVVSEVSAQHGDRIPSRGGRNSGGVPRSSEERRARKAGVCCSTGAGS